MTTLPNMGLTLPTRGSSGAGAWGDTLDANLALEDAHDHSSGKGARIPTSGIALNADLPFSSLYAPTQLHRLQFSEIAGGGLSNANNLSLFVSDGTGGLTAHELYFRTSAGNNIKFTSGSSLNVAAFVGGIGGDYSSVNALLSYDDAGKQYKHLQGGGTTWARMTGGGLRLAELGTTETVYVEQLAPAALGASYSVTWPTALPGSQQLLQVDALGQVAFSNTLASGSSITLSGSGVVKHGTYTLQLPFSSWVGQGITAYGGASNTVGGAASLQLWATIYLPAGKRILAIRVTFIDNASGPTTFKVVLRSISNANVATDIASSSTSAGNGSRQTLTISSLTTVVTSGTSYMVEFRPVSGSGGASGVYMGEVDYDQP